MTRSKQKSGVGIQGSGFRRWDSADEGRHARPFRPSTLNRQPSTLRSGFTLIELLVSIGILLILATITFTMVGAAMKGDSIRSGARQIQSYVEGARDRALHAKADRGVRFLRDPNALNTVNALVFIQSQDPETNQTLGDFRIHFTDHRTLQPLASWDELREKGLLDVNGTRIEIDGNYYTMTYPHDDGDGNQCWRLTKTFIGWASLVDTNPYPMGDRWADAPTTPYVYSITLLPAVMPSQEPRLLPSGVVIDLSHGRYPWGATDNMDIMFSPRGTITGLISSYGNIHFLLADTRDVDRGMGYFDIDANGNMTIDPDEKHKGDNLLVTITTLTGKVTSHPVSHTSGDPFEYAETGAEAK